MLNFDVFALVKFVWRCVLGVVLVEHLMHKLGQISAADWNFCCCKRYGIAFVDGYCVCDTFARIKNCSSCPACCEKRQNSLVSDVKFWHFEFGEPVTEELNSEFTYISSTRASLILGSLLGGSVRMTLCSSKVHCITSFIKCVKTCSIFSMS